MEEEAKDEPTSLLSAGVAGGQRAPDKDGAQCFTVGAW